MEMEPTPRKPRSRRKPSTADGSAPPSKTRRRTTRKPRAAVDTGPAAPDAATDVAEPALHASTGEATTPAASGAGDNTAPHEPAQAPPAPNEVERTDADRDGNDTTGTEVLSAEVAAGAPNAGAGAPDGEHAGTPVIPLHRSSETAAVEPRTEVPPGSPAPPTAGTSRTRVNGAGFKESALRTAREKFANDPFRRPLTETQIDRLLHLLHEPGQDRTLVSSTYAYLVRGMSQAHAAVQIKKLRGTFRQDRTAA